MRPLVLVHGWGCDPQVWAPLREMLDQAEQHVIDLNPLLQQYQSLPGLLSDMREEAPPGATWIGSSLGGTLCSLLNRTAPDRLASVVTIGTNPCFVARSDWPHAMDEKSFSQFEQGLDHDPVRTCQRFQALATQGDRQALRRLGTLTSHLSIRLGALRTGLSILRETDLRDYWHAPERPHLAIFGRRDALVPAAAGERWSHSSMQTCFLDSDHLPWISRPETVANAIHKFVTEAA